MYIKTVAAIVSALAISSALAEPSNRTMVKFGNEDVELKFSNIPDGERRQQLWDATNEAADPAEQERFWRMRWEEFGEATALQSLAVYHLDRGDYVSGYAHLYAVDKIAKWFVDTVTRSDYKGSPLGRYVPPGPMAKQQFAEIEADMNLIGEKLTASQRESGVKVAAKLIRDNPNCCAWP